MRPRTIHSDIPSARRFLSAKCLALVPALAAILSGCPPREGGARDPRAQPQTATVAVAAVTKRDAPLQVRSFGRVEPYATVSVRAQTEGIIASVHFQEGQAVRKESLLFTIDPKPADARVRQLESALARDEVQAANAKREADRAERLFRDGTVPQEISEQKRTAADAAAAVVRADQAALDSAKLGREYCFIKSPLDGVTGELLLHQGNSVKAYDQAMVVVNQIKPVYVTFAVPQDLLPDIRSASAGGPLAVDVSIPGRAEQRQGPLTVIDNTVEVATGTIRLKATIPNEDQFLWPGQFVTVALTLRTARGALIVPTRAIQTGQPGTFVFAIKPDRTATIRKVRVGWALDGETVLEDGLAEGETVVTDGQLRLTEGTKVEIQTEKGPAATPQSTAGPAERKDPASPPASR